STPDFILSTYITPITQLAKQIQEHETNIEIIIDFSDKRERQRNKVILQISQHG
ncbi:unnamed protein product, partial [Rotaria sp. Silwood1]